jgi:hypothetical protein
MASSTVKQVNTYKERTYSNASRTKSVRFAQNIREGRRTDPEITFMDTADAYYTWNSHGTTLTGPGFDTLSGFSITSTFVAWLDDDHYMVLGGRDAFLYKNNQYLHTMPYITHETGYDHISLTIDPTNTTLRMYNHHKTGEPMYEFRVYYAVDRASGYDPEDCDMVRTFRFSAPEPSNP